MLLWMLWLTLCAHLLYDIWNEELDMGLDAAKNLLLFTAQVTLCVKSFRTDAIDLRQLRVSEQDSG